MLTRRDWMRAAGRAAVATAVARHPTLAASAQPSAPTPPRQSVLCFFSKHLPDLGWSELARAVMDAGFDGVDLTVRPGGHVLPERAPDDLPAAVEAITARGLKVPMITTDLTSTSGPIAKPLLQAAARSGVRYFKTGYWRYTASPDVRGQVAAAGDALAGLAALARECGIEMGFHNHAGYIGAALWDIAPAIDRLEPQWAGYYYDPRHAVAEGGGGAWKAATHLVAPRLKMVALKDFFWNKGAQGWRIEDCPLGEGQVDWAWVGSALREAHFAGPISLHFEYEIAANTPQERTRRTLQAAARDLAFARRFLSGRQELRARSQRRT
jgi:L-ribulose-5-phosphate 3-epimerase